MIEFKAKCGHTVRARDEDAGGAVRCSYCGRDTDVPEEANDFDVLLSDLENVPESPNAVANREPQKKKGRFGKRGLGRKRTGVDFDPFSIVLRLGYAAFAIIALVLVYQYGIKPLVSGDASRGRQAAARSPAASQEKPRRRVRASKATRKADRTAGLVVGAAERGLFVASTPPGATIFYIDAQSAPKRGRIHRCDGCVRLQDFEDGERVGDGTYVVEVAFPWHEPQLNAYGDDYFAFRRSIENATDRERRRLMAAYFLPDEATDVFVDVTDEQIFLVRQYRGVAVRKGEPGAVRALFLPRIVASHDGSFSIETLVRRYVPSKKQYAFNVDHVRTELQYYGVTTTDQPFVLEALARIGLVPYIMADGRTRLFKIGILDGVFAAPIIPHVKG